MPTILVVDDEQANLDALSRALGDADPSWLVCTASGVAPAVKRIASGVGTSEQIDVLLTDLVMASDTSGMTLIQNARQHDPLIMSILFTAKEKSLDRYAAFDYGAFDVVEKNIRGTSASREIIVKTKAALRYRDWARQISYLRRYFDPKLYSQLDADPAFLEMRERTCTVGFWDIRGFSLLCEILKGHPQLIADFLSEYCEMAAEIVFSHRGVLDKFIGDGVMAIFGLFDDGSPDNGAIQALQAAQVFRDRFELLQKEHLERWKKSTPQQILIGLGCGLHTGEALVGNVGKSARKQFTALGSAVNFAARIEARAKHSQILVSQSIEARVRGQVALVAVEPISDIKNIPGTFDLFELASRNPFLPRGVDDSAAEA